MSRSATTTALIALVAAALGFGAGYAWRRHTHPSAAEQWDKASRELRKGLLGE